MIFLKHFEVKMSSSFLPPGWQELQDENGTTYYYNEVTDESSWEFPIHLSEGWQELQDENGTTYYYNKSTGETSWEKPENLSFEDFYPEVKKEGKGKNDDKKNKKEEEERKREAEESQKFSSLVSAPALVSKPQPIVATQISSKDSVSPKWKPQFKTNSANSSPTISAPSNTSISQPNSSKSKSISCPTCNIPIAQKFCTQCGFNPTPSNAVSSASIPPSKYSSSKPSELPKTDSSKPKQKVGWAMASVNILSSLVTTKPPPTSVASISSPQLVSTPASINKPPPSRPISTPTPNSNSNPSSPSIKQINSDSSTSVPCSTCGETITTKFCTRCGESIEKSRQALSNSASPPPAQKLSTVFPATPTTSSPVTAKSNCIIYFNFSFLTLTFKIANQEKFLSYMRECNISEDAILKLKEQKVNLVNMKDLDQDTLKEFGLVIFFFKM